MAGIIGADTRFGRDFNHPDPGMQGNITALYDIGCVVGSIVCYFFRERFGRRTMLMSGGTIMIIGAAILASSYGVAQLIIGRIVTGIGNGMNSSTGPVYQSECSPASYRGALLTLQGTVTILGVVIAYWYVSIWKHFRAEEKYLLIKVVGWIMGPASRNLRSNGASRLPFRRYSPFSLSSRLLDCQRHHVGSVCMIVTKKLAL